MLRRDYLVRMIEEMTEILGKVFGLKQERKFTEALWQLDDLYKRQFRLSNDLLRSLSAKDIVEIFHTGGKLEVDKLQNLAYLMKEEGNLLIAAGQQDEGTFTLMKSLHLYLTAAQGGADRTLWKLADQIDELIVDLNKYRLPKETEQLRLQYEEAEGRYGRAEDIIYIMLQEQWITREEALAFYERLLQMDHSTLSQGGLPIEEVHEALQELRNIN
ncbi:DUF6483 family protein [Paenibacillus turicensis]|uniref:DUF6483 family protein n=1 Tax=Paenibacillus turicensis TaxID=160487 RepID=UPI003D2863CA